MSLYCEYTETSTDSGIELHKEYHDKHYGYPISNDNELFGRLILEINQAGLSWLTILKKEQSFKTAYSNFDIKSIANYTAEDEARLLSDAGIIRNRLKVKAAILNANVILGIQKEFGSFKSWLDSQGTKSIKEWVSIFKKSFKFTGGEIVNEFLVSTGYLKGAHAENCPIYNKVLALKPLWYIRQQSEDSVK